MYEVLFFRIRECYFIRKRGFCRCGGVKCFEMRRLFWFFRGFSDLFISVIGGR